MHYRGNAYIRLGILQHAYSKLKKSITILFKFTEANYGVYLFNWQGKKLVKCADRTKRS